MPRLWGQLDFGGGWAVRGIWILTWRQVFSEPRVVHKHPWPSPAQVCPALYVLTAALLGSPDFAFPNLHHFHSFQNLWSVSGASCSQNTAGYFYHFSGCFRQSLFSCSLLLKYINAWCHSLWLIKLPLWVTAVWLGGKWHPKLQADSKEADFACDLMPEIDPGSTEEDIREMMQGSLPNGPCQRPGGRWLLVPVAARETACSLRLPFFSMTSLASTSLHTAGCTILEEILIYNYRQCLLKYNSRL